MKIVLYFSILASLVFAEWKTSTQLKINTGLYSSIKNNSFQDTADVYGTNWRAYWIDAETAKSWDETPDLFNVIVKSSLDSTVTFFADLNLRRDVEAWYQDQYSGNVILGDNELDINTPTHVFASFSSSLLSAKIGRFPQVYGPSPSRGVALSGTPWHDAMELQLNVDKMRITFFASSLNPYLIGVQNTDGTFPTNSEWQAQKLTPVSNQRQRVYDEATKHLFVHRFSFEGEKLNFALMESIVIGGKEPTFRDINPFIAYHNNYPDGLANLILSLDASYAFFSSFKGYGEFAMDDLRGGNAEGEDSAPNILAWLLGSEWSGMWKDHKIGVRVEWVHTDPMYGNRDLPLLKHTSRYVLRSNYRLREDVGFGDTYLVDYPIGYIRGSDIDDYWLDFFWHYENVKWKGSLGYLRSGLFDLSKPFLQGKGSNGADNVVVEELRLSSNVSYSINKYFQTEIGGLYRMFPEENQRAISSSNWGLTLGLTTKFSWE